MVARQFTGTPGGTYRVWPASGDLGDGVVPSAVSGRPGLFSVEVDFDASSEWYVFEGAAEPDNWDLWLWKIERRPLIDYTPAEEGGPVVIEPGDNPDTSIGYLVCLDGEGQPQQDVVIAIQMVRGPGQAGYSYDSPVRRGISDADGLVQFDGLVRGATYRVWRSSSPASLRRTEATVPDLPTFALPEVL